MTTKTATRTKKIQRSITSSNYTNGPAIVVATLDISDGYFSLTGEVWNATKAGAIDKRYTDCTAAGQVREDILRAFPELAPFAAAHLCDVDTGRPIHAIANGCYHLRNGDRNAAARAFGISIDQLPALEQIATEGPTTESINERMTAILEPTWAATRDAALACYEQTA